ncbi:anti sigma factor C-terminal domain-containing protein [Dethiobacter alkaliphilus]|uniref:Anti-sigma-W factor RsiW n=1 Tax=Dethiobacter alkaliphilus AHT 1 TaxID=555088 RepID=C0GDU7_DETAL|nr:anti sigma factor C-terminal domain-containing protein [Dethiobacter alkaliphilus]EEG78580.1 hypothetical protein DealDRAFT_0510 [Dethiobacter alkaliphilus AHT 1]
MSPLICEVVNDLWPLYQENQLSSKTVLEIEEHLKGCPECRKMISATDEAAGLISQLDAPLADSEKEKSMLRRAQTRLRYKLLATVVLATVFLYFSLSYIPVGQRYEQYAEDAKKALSIIMEMTQPGTEVLVAYSNRNIISVYGERSLPNIKTTWEVQVDRRGVMDIKEFRQEPANLEALPWPWRTDIGTQYDNSLRDEQQEILERLPEWSEAEAVISFYEDLTPAEVSHFLSDRNLRPLHAAFHADIPDYDGEGAPWLPRFGFSLVDDNLLPATQQSVIRKSEAFLEELIWLSERYHIIENIFGYPRVNDIVDYVQENGFEISGITVRGPAEDLKILFEDEQVRSVHIGEIAFRRR